MSEPGPSPRSEALGRRIDGESPSDVVGEGGEGGVRPGEVGRRIDGESPSDGLAEQLTTPRAVSIAEEPYGASDAAVLLDLMAAEVERRYADASIGDGAHEPGADARPAPPSLPPGDPGWAVTELDVTRPRGLFVVARLGREPVGCAALRPLPGGPAGVGEIKRVFTTDVARRRGVGRRLLHHLVAEAPGLGFRTLVLETGTAQPEAMAFYEREGWVPVVPYGEYASSSATRCYLLDL